MSWVDELRAECHRHGLKDVALRVGYSKATLSQVLNGKYPSDISKVQERIESVLMGRTVDCPVLGDITVNVCRSHQSRKFSVTNPLRVQMYRACRNQCPHSGLCKE